MEQEVIRLTSLSHGGGCGCQLAPALLTEMLSELPRQRSAPPLTAGQDTGNNLDSSRPVSHPTSLPGWGVSWYS